jgi:hypothetical protein
MTAIVEMNVSPDPRYILLLGSITVVANSDGLAHLGEAAVVGAG